MPDKKDEMQQIIETVWALPRKQGKAYTLGELMDKVNRERGKVVVKESKDD